MMTNQSDTDRDATIVTAHSGKQQAAPTWRRRLGFTR
jgi:hypothetical protein